MLALTIGLLATAASWLMVSLGGHLVTHADLALYDRWAARPPVATPAPVVIVEDDTLVQDTDALPWDHAALARVLAALTQADAAAIGLDEYMTSPSSPDHGGASIDALLAETIAQSDRLVLPVPLIVQETTTRLSSPADFPADIAADSAPHRSWPLLTNHIESPLFQAEVLRPLLPSLAESASALAHQVAVADQDGHLRRVPLALRLHDRWIPAFGLALYLTAQGVTADRVSLPPDCCGAGDLWLSIPHTDGGTKSLHVPVDATTSLLLPALARQASTAATISLSQLLTAVERHDIEQLRSWASGQVVWLPSTTTTRDSRLSERRQAPQLALLLALYRQDWAAATSAPWNWLVTWLLGAVTAWLFMSREPWRGIAGSVACLGLYGIAAWVALSQFHLVLPLVMPIASLLVASLGTVLWTHRAAGLEVQRLERNVFRVQAELAALREALAYQESLVDRLEEDVETERTRSHQATDRQQLLSEGAAQLQQELDQARASEEVTRRELAALEKELAGLRAIALVHPPLPDAEWERVRQEAASLGILTRDTRLLHTFRDLARGAQSSLPILILGESGTGKELFARAVHQLSPRRARPFIAVNMAAISPELFESELFGHVRGSFTGATQDRPGYFELASGGTIFLDEIGDLRPEHQAKLLRVLQDRSFYRVGATKPTVVELRVVAATNKDLTKGIAEGWFREDLYARLKGLLVTLPALRERPDDVLFLADHFLSRASAQAGHRELSFTPEALTAMRQHTWPQNIRELAQCIERAVALADTALIYAKDLRLTGVEGEESADRRGVRPASHRASVTAAEPFVAASGQSVTASGRSVMASGQSVVASGPCVMISSDQAVLERLRSHAFDMQATARALGWDRSTVTQRLKGLCFQSLVECSGDVAKAAAILAQDPAFVRTVELKLLEYRDHLWAVVAGYSTEAEAVQGCRKRFKNLPERHFKAVVALIHRQFHPSVPLRPSPPRHSLPRAADQS